MRRSISAFRSSLQSAWRAAWPARRSSGRGRSVRRRADFGRDGLAMQSLEPRFALAADGPTLVANVAPGPNSSFPADFTQAGPLTFFTATHSSLGNELWKTDGTTAGTVVVKDINPGNADAGPSYLVAVGSKVYFSADDGAGAGDRGLWVSDGTAEGTKLIAGPTSAAPIRNPSELTVVGNDIFFKEAGALDKLYKIDVTAANPTPKLLKLFAFSYSYTAFQGKLYFAADDGAGKGAELWVSDGSSEGTKIAADINSADGSFPVELTVLAPYLYFAASDNVFGQELWRFDGTTAKRMTDINPFGGSSALNALAVAGGKLYFSAYDGSEREAYTLDNATEAVTKIDVNPGANSSFPSEFTAFNGFVYFTATHSTFGTELFRTNGTTADVVDVAPGAVSSSPSKITVVNGQLVFAASSSAGDTELYRLAPGGTAATILKNVRDGGSSFPAAGGKMSVVGGVAYFNADDGIHGREVWKTDGTPTGTVLVRDANDNVSGLPPSSSEGVKFRGQPFFAASPSGAIQELLSTDGTEAGLVKWSLGTPAANVTKRSVSQLVVSPSGDALYVVVEDQDAFARLVNSALWKLGAAANAPEKIKDFAVVAPHDLLFFKGRLYFGADGGAGFGDELWVSDGTNDGTRPFGAGFQFTGQRPTGLTALNGILYYAATDTAAGTTLGRELWKTDGNDNLLGTGVVSDINTFGDASPENLTAFGNRLYFTANGRDANNNYGVELYVYDGVAAKLVKDIEPGAGGSSSPYELTVYKNSLYFGAFTSLNGKELWRTDGTAAGTTPVRDINPSNQGAASSNPYQLTVAGSGTQAKLYFGADDGTRGRELWYTDGSTTDIVRNLNPNTESYPTSITAAAGRLFFDADDGTTGDELWQVDPVTNTMTQVADLLFGSNGSFPRGLVPGPRRTTVFPSQYLSVDGTLYFSADDNVAGQELWKISLDTVAPVPGVPVLSGAGIYGVASTIDIAVPFSEVVFVGGSPQIALTIGGVTRQAAYVGGTGTASLTFRYTVAAGDNAPAGIVVGGVIGLNGGTIRDAANNDAVLAIPAVNGSGVTIDTQSPTAGTPTVVAGLYGVGNSIDVTVPFSEVVFVGGSPQIALTIGGVTRQAAYVGGTGTASLTFRYTVAAGDNAPAGIVVGGVIGLNGGTIRDAANNDAVLAIPAVNGSGVTIDTFLAIVSVTPPAPGKYAAKSVVRLSITFSDIVKFSKKATPTISIVVGKTARKLTYVSGVGTNTLVFSYKVVPADRHKNLPLRVTSGIVMPKKVFIVDAGGKRLDSYAFQTVTSGVFLGKA